MNFEIFLKDVFESIPEYRQIVLVIISIQNDKDLLQEVGFSERDINRSKLEFKNILKNNMRNIWNMLKTRKNLLLRNLE